MAIEPPESGLTWLRVPLSEAVRVTIMGPAASYRSHWVRLKGRKGMVSGRCMGGAPPGCRMCGRGLAWKARYLLPVRGADGVRLLEVGRVQYPFLALREARGDWRGMVITVGREWAAKNAPITLTQQSYEHVSEEEEVNVEGVAATEGLEMYRVWCSQQDVIDPEWTEAEIVAWREEHGLR